MNKYKNHEIMNENRKIAVVWLRSRRAIALCAAVVQMSSDYTNLLFCSVQVRSAFATSLHANSTTVLRVTFLIDEGSGSLSLHLGSLVCARAQAGCSGRMACSSASTSASTEPARMETVQEGACAWTRDRPQHETCRHADMKTAHTL